MLIDITLPFPPSINTLYATVQGRRVLSAAGREYKKEVAWLLTQRYGQRTEIPKRTALAVEVLLVKDNLYKYDWDGPIKVLQDAVFEWVTKTGCHNDAWIVEAHVKKELATVGTGSYCHFKMWSIDDVRDL